MQIILVIITWFGLAAPYTLEIETDSINECESLKHRIEMSWIDQGLPDGFGYIMECQVGSEKE